MSLGRIAVLVSNDLTFDQRVRKTCETLISAGWEPVLVGRRMRRSDATSIDRPYATMRMWLPFRSGPFFYLTLQWGLARALRLLAGGDDGKKTTSSRRRSAALLRGQKRGARTKINQKRVGVAALPGELLAFAEILCDAALDGSATHVVSDADEAEGERQAARYEVGDDEFDPDEPL